MSWFNQLAAKSGVEIDNTPAQDTSNDDNAWKYISVGDISGLADYTNRNYNYRTIPFLGQIVGHAADAATQGVADVAQFAGAQGIGDYLNEKAQEGEAELPAMSKPEVSLAYLTDPNGLASAFGTMAGSMLSMAPVAALAPEFLPARAAAALSRVPKTLSAVPKIGGALEEMAPMAGRFALTGPVEAMMEGGNTEREMLQNGATPEEARQAAWDVFGENVGLLTATNALEGGLLGKIKIKTPRFSNPVANTASRAAGYVPTTAAEMALQGYEEGAQQGIQNGVEGESPNTFGQILNPTTWTDDQWDAAKMGIAGAVPLMGAMGAVRHFGNRGGSGNSENGSNTAANSLLSQAQADINSANAQAAAQAQQDNASQENYTTPADDTTTSFDDSQSSAPSYDASVLEGDPQYTVSDEVSSTDVTPLTDQKMRLLDAAYYNKYGRHLYVTSMKRNGDGSSWHDSGQAFDTADDTLESDKEARDWLIDEGSKLGLVALDEYENPSAHATGGHVHFSDHGDPISGGVSLGNDSAESDVDVSTLDDDTTSTGADLSNLPLGNIAMAISQNTGLPANLIWAQLAHESADGTSQLAQEDHNYGGVKGTDGNYLHFDNDQQFIDYMSNYYPKYREDGIFEAKNADEWAEALKHGGYFTVGLDEYEGGMKRHLAEAGLSENAMSGGRARGGKGSSNGNSAAPDLSTTFDIDADNDGMRDMFSGFASEWSKYANDQKGVNFFGNMFDADGNFEDTPENRIAILEKYGKEFQQYADSQMNQTLDERVNAAINQAVADKDLNRMNALTAAKQAHDTAAMSKLVGPEKRQHFDVGKALAQAKAQRVKTNASTQQAQPQEQTQAAPVQNPAPETTPYSAALFNAQAKELPTEPIARIGALAAMAEDARLMGNMQAHDAVKQEMNRYAQANGISSDLKLDQLPEDQQLAYMQAIYEQKARTAQAVRAMATNETPENLANLDKHINSMQVAAAQIRNMRAQMKQATPTQQAQAPTPTKAKPVPPANQVTDVDHNSHFDINKIEATQKALKAEQAASSAKAKSYMNDADKIVSRYQAGKFDANDSIHQLENLKKKANNDKVLNDSDKNAVMQHADECIAKIKPQEEQNHETENNRKTAETTQSSTAEEHQNQNAEPEKGSADAEESEVNGHFDTSDFKHTKTGELISAAKLIERDKPKFNRARAMVKKYGGYYNSYAKRFFFKDDADHSKRDAFVADAEKELYGQQAQPEAQEQPKEEPAKAETPKEEAPKKEAKLEQEQPASNGANNPDGFYGFTDGKNPRTVERIKERLATPMDNGETAKDFVESMAKAGDKKVTLKPRGFGFSDYFIDGQKIPKAGYYYFKYLTEHHVFGGTEFSGGKLKTDIGEALAKKYNISTDEATALTAKAKPEEKQRVFLNDEETFANLESALGLKPSKKASGKDEVSNDNKLFKKADADEEAKLKAEIDKLAAEFNKEASKLSANPMFNPKIYEIGAKLGIAYVRLGYTKFKPWAEALADKVGDSVKPWLDSIWNGIRALPTDAEFNEKTFSAVVNYCGNRYEAGMTSFEEIFADFDYRYGDQYKDMNGEEGYNSFKDYLHAAFIAMDTRMNPENYQKEETENGEEQRTSGGTSGRPESVQSGTAGVSEGEHEGRHSDVSGEVSGRGGREREADVREHEGADSKESRSGEVRTGRGVEETAGKGAGTGTGEQSASLTIAQKKPSPTEVPGHDYEIKGTEKKTESVRYKQNIAAIKMLKELEADNRMPTPSEQDILGKYNGWGGMGKFFKEGTKENKELKDLLTPEEYAAARSTINDAFYTDPDIVKAVWKGVSRLGFKGGRVLDPSMGIGNFFGCMPRDMMQKSRLHGVEIDSLTSRFSKMLYPSAYVENKPFQKAKTADNYFDLVISNIPFGDLKIDGYNIHNYFFASGIDKVRPGGLMVFITSQGSLAGGTDAARMRKYLAGRADMIAAYKMPSGTFANAGTSVGTDIVIFRKRDVDNHQSPYAQNFVNVDDHIGIINGKPEHMGYIGYSMNTYFKDHPENILGTLGEGKNQFGEYVLQVTPKKGTSIAQSLEKAMNKLPQDIYTPITRTNEKAFNTVEANKQARLDEKTRDYEFFIKDGKAYQRQADQAVPVEKNIATVKDYIKLKNTMNALMAAQMDPKATDKQLAALRKMLNKDYDSFVAKHGNLNGKAQYAFRDDPSAGMVMALEKNVKTTGRGRSIKVTSADKAEIFTQRTVQAVRDVKTAKTPSDALVASLVNKGYVDVGYMSKLLNEKESSIVAALKGKIFKDPITEDYVTREEYLSGNVRQKLAQAEEAAKADKSYEGNVDELKKVVPEDLVSQEIHVNMGSPWIPESDVQAFLDSFDSGLKVTFMRDAAKWYVKGASWRNVPKYKAEGISFMELVDCVMNNRAIEIYDGPKKDKVLDRTKTDAANVVADNLRHDFEKWLWTDKEREKRLVRYYNDNFNNLVNREYDGSHLTFPGMNKKIHMRPWQANVVWRMLQSGNTLIAHCVGAGKTFEMQAAGMEMRRLGIANKPLYCLPNNVVKQFEDDFRKLYPEAKILKLTNEDLPAVPNHEVDTKDDGRKVKRNVELSELDPKERKKILRDRAKRNRTLARIQTEDWDAIIMSHTLFERLPLTPETAASTIKEQIDTMERTIKLAKGSLETKDISNLEKKKLSLQNRLENILHTDLADIGIPFEKLGIDQIFVDEADLFKNLHYATSMERVSGLANSDANRSNDMFAKTQWLTKQNNGRGVVFATGTPISNTMAELFTMMRYLDMRGLKEKELDLFDNWIRTFADIGTGIERKPSGDGFRKVNKVKQFINMADLSKMFRKFADIKTQDDIDLDLPELKGGKPTIVKIAADPELVRYIKEDVPKRVQEMKHTKPGTKGADNMLKLTGDLRKKSLNDDKINACAEKIVQKYNDTTDVKGAQLVFCDMGVPRGVADKVTKKDMEAADLEDKLDNESTYEKLIARLVELGIPREQIAYAQSAKDRDEMNEIFKKVDSGDVRVLIGSTQKMGAGTNCQHHLVALHDLDAPWRPRDLEQRHGRILRQGNQNKEVEIFNYVVQDSFDANMWEKLKNKAAIIAQAMSNDTSLRTVEDADVVTLSYAEVESAATGNPLIKKQLDLRGEVTKYNNARTQFMKQQRDAERDIAELPEQIEEQKDIIAKIDDDIKARQDTKGDNFKMEVGGKTYTAREEAQKALEAEMDKLPKEASKTIGKLGGFNVQASATLANGKKLLLVCNRAYSPSTGTVRGLENALRTIEKIRDMRQTDLERYERKLKDAQEIVKLPDQYAEKLEAAENELQEVTRQINETMVEGNGPETPNTGLDEAPTADTEAKYSIDGKPIVGRKYSLAWHGSPARFEQFDLSYMGSGEGAQAHGWGLYFAKNRETSQNRYLDRISGKDSEKTLYAVDIPEENTMLDENKSFAEQPKKVQEAIDKIIDDVPIGWLNRAIRGKSGREFDELTHKYNMWEKYTASGRAYQDRANLLRNYRDAKTDEESMRSADALYGTYEQLYDNGDEMVERYMNDEGLLNREIQSLERRAQSDFDNAAKYNKGLREYFAKSIKDGTGFDLYTRIGHMHYNIYWDYHHGFTKVNPVFEKIQKEYGFDGVSNSQWASLVLNAYGVNGITYNGGIDGRCYVVFDDKAIRIIKKYDANNPDELARQSVDDIVQQIKDTLPNTATFKQDGSRLTATMPNGAKLTFDIKDIIELKGKEAEKARAAHGIPASMPITVNGRAYTVNGNAFIELARDGKPGTAAHELTHVAYELYLTDKEKAALRKAAEKEAMLKGRDIEEEIADNVRDYYLQRKEQKLAKNYGKLMQKIIKAIQTIRDMFTGAYQAKKAMEAITSGEVWTRKANTTSDTAERFSVNPKKAIQNHFGKRAQTQNHPRNVKAMLEDLTKMKVRFGKLDPKMNVVYKKFEGVIRARNANEWETVLPEAGRAIAERLGLKPTDQMNHYIAQWLLDQTGNNRSQEALDFEAAMKKNLPISDQLIDLKTLFSDRNNREADDIVHDIIEYDQKKDPLFSKTTLAKKWRGFYDSVIEELGPVKRLVQEVEKKSGQKIGAAVNPYTAFRLYRGHYGKAMTMIEGKSEGSVKALQTVYPSVDFTGFKTIRMILDECGALHDDARLKDLLAYALACHVLDIHEKNNNVRMRQQNLQNKIAATKDKNLQKKYKKQIDDLEREIMEVPRTEDGLALTEDRCREVIKKHSAEYGQAQQDLVHFSKVTAAILYDAGVIGKKRFNELMHSYPNYIPMFRVFEDNEDVNFGDSLKHMHGSSRRVINPLESIIRNTYEFTRRAERNKARQLIANLTRISDVGEFIEEVDNKKPNDKTTITYYENGEVKYLQTDPDIVKAVNRMGQKQSNWVARFLAIPAKIARACFTTANPAFAVGNVIRDTTDATFYSKYGFKPWDFVRGFLHAIHHDEMFYEWLASGAAQASAISLDRDYTSSTLNQMTKTWKQRLLSRHALSAILDGMQMIGEYSEYGTRIAAYERARTQLAKQGAPHLPAYDLAAAALESRDLMDFARGGTGSRYMNSAIPFANAAIQGIDKTIRTFDFVHDRKNATKALVRLMLWGMLPAFALALMHRDDDWWKELPDWQKETNWIIGKVGNTIIRIPKGQDLALRFFSSLIEKAIDRSKHKAIDYARPFWDALPSFMPIAMLPPLEVITNHTFFTGGPVVPRYQQDLPAAMQYGNETSSIAKFFGKELGISPRNIEHILFGYTGNMGKGLLGLFDTLTGQRSLNTNIDEAPVISRFTVMPYKQSKTVTDFYDKYEEQNKLYREFKATGKKPKDFNPALYQRLKTNLKDMSQVNKDERAAIENPRMPASTRKAKQISFQNRRIAIARKALGADR